MNVYKMKKPEVTYTEITHFVLAEFNRGYCKDVVANKLRHYAGCKTKGEAADLVTKILYERHMSELNRQRKSG